MFPYLGTISLPGRERKGCACDTWGMLSVSATTAIGDFAFLMATSTMTLALNIEEEKNT